MAISYVTGGTGASSNGGTVTISFSGWDLQENDVVIVGGGHGNNQTPSPSTSGYTSIGSLGTGSNNPRVGAWAKAMGSSPDANVVMNGSGSGISETAFWAIALRGADTSTYTDATSTTVTGSSNPPAITTNTAGAWVLAFWFAAAGTVTTQPSGYSNLVQRAQSGTWTISVAVSTFEKSSPGSEDPGTYTISGGTTVRCITMAIKPAAAAGGGGMTQGRLTNSRLLGRLVA